MAQPVFDGHPLEAYFQDSGEVFEPMPGAISEFSLQPYVTDSPSTFKHSARMEKICLLIFNAIQSLYALFSHRASLRTQAFAERFKYGVISSSLLSPACGGATPMAESHRRGMSPPLPGRLPNSHSRTPSAAESMLSDTLSLSLPAEPDTPMWPMSLSLTIVVGALSARLYFLALLLFAGILYYMRVRRPGTHPKPDVITPSLLALQHLISAGQLWDMVINDAFTILENEERSLFYGATTPLTSSTSLRVALSTSLLTTQTQCDNVRQLLSAITSPSELAQLSEMYAPPSPIKSTFRSSRRPLSHPGPSLRDTPRIDRMQKRSTWNGSYAALARAGARPPSQLAQRRAKRRSDLSALINTTSPTPVRTRVPPSSPPQLADVSEEEDGMVTAPSSLSDDDQSSFGTAALSLYRTRLRPLSLSHRPPTLSPGSKYTTLHATKHALALAPLRQAHQHALASKRFACAHLLALRFEDDEDEVYWEDVRAVMSLLTSTLVDASAHLSDVLEDVERLETEESLSAPDPFVLPTPPRVAHTTPVSFAPTPSHLAQFAAHVDALSTALDDARTALEQSLARLRPDADAEDPGSTHNTVSPGHSSHPSTSSSSTTQSDATTLEDGPAIRAYERVRHALGQAVREWERGRAVLGCMTKPPTPLTEEEELPVVPVPHADADANPNPTNPDDISHTDPEPTSDPKLVAEEEKEEPVVVVEEDELPRLTVSHLLPNTEHLFESEAASSSSSPRPRPTTTLSRAERIRIARAKRAASSLSSSSPLPPPPPSSSSDVWGPTEDVVRELKAVIDAVGRQRRPRTVGVETCP